VRARQAASGAPATAPVPQIELDLPRTFTDQADFVAAVNEVRGRDGTAPSAEGGAVESDGSAAMDGSVASAGVRAASCSAGSPGSGTIIAALRRLLRAFTSLHPTQAYTQSMNYVAAFALLVHTRTGEATWTTGSSLSSRADAEEAAFWTFEYLTATALAGYYSPDLRQLRADCDVFSHMLARNMPAIHAHLHSLGMADVSSLFLPRWLLCMYLNVFAAPITVRIWDAALLAGRDAPCVLVQVALAVVRMNAGPLLACRTFVDAVELLKDAGDKVEDALELMALAQSPECRMDSGMPSKHAAATGSSPSGWVTLKSPGSPAPLSRPGRGGREVEAEPFIVALRRRVEEAGGGPFSPPAGSSIVPGGASAPVATPAVGSKRRRDILGSPLTGGGGGGGGGVVSVVTPMSPRPSGTAPASTPVGSAALPRSPTVASPPVPIAASLERLFTPLQARTAMARLRSPLSPLTMVQGNTHAPISATTAAKATPQVARRAGITAGLCTTPGPMLASFAEALNPSVATGMMSARKRRTAAPPPASSTKATKPAHRDPAPPPTSSASVAGAATEAAGMHPGAYAEYDADPHIARAIAEGAATSWGVEEHGQGTAAAAGRPGTAHCAELMAFGPRTAKKARRGDAV